ncbi:MAG: hypothetical protein SCALA701_25260 [Candidatus Scalindua sp.]|nr:MAG: hypothetical protein SCALA701_25260 [Candidatus Scalindua sp.]
MLLGQRGLGDPGHPVYEGFYKVIHKKGPKMIKGPRTKFWVLYCSILEIFPPIKTIGELKVFVGYYTCEKLQISNHKIQTNNNFQCSSNFQ